MKEVLSMKKVTALLLIFTFVLSLTATVFAHPGRRLILMAVTGTEVKEHTTNIN